MSAAVAHAKSLLVPSLRALGPALAKALAADEKRREQGYHAIGELLDERKLTKVEAQALVRLASEVTFPPQVFDWNDTAHELLFPLVTNPFPALVAPLRAAYAKVPQRARAAILAALGAIGTRPAAEAFMACLRDTGWPPATYDRVFWELPKLAKVAADVVFPELVVRAGAHLGSVTNVLIDALGSGALDAREVDLEPVAPLALAALKNDLPRVRATQKAGTAWRFRESYHALRTATGAWLDVAGYVKAPALEPLLRKALALADPKLVAFAACSLIRRGSSVPDAVLERVAADPETRAQLYAYLEALGALGRFPARWRTWETFAAAEMVTWLMYPSELGHMPAQIQLMQRFTAGTQVLYVWEFLDGKTWKAGVTGPYVEKGAPRPLWGASTFSRFERAASKTAEQHALSVLETLAAWRKAHAAEDAKRATVKRATVKRATVKRATVKRSGAKRAPAKRATPPRA